MSEETLPVQPAGTPVSRFSKETRQYIYDTVAAALPLLLIAGIVVDQVVIQAILGFIGVALGVGSAALARSNAVELPKP